MLISAIAAIAFPFGMACASELRDAFDFQTGAAMLFDDIDEMLAAATIIAIAPYLASALWDRYRLGKRTNR